MSPLPYLLLTGPAARAIVAVQPGGGLGIGDRVKRRLAGPWRAGPGAGHELEQSGGAAVRVHGVGVIARFAVSDAQRPYDRSLAERTESVGDDLGDVGGRRWVVVERGNPHRLSFGRGQCVLLRLVVG